MEKKKNRLKALLTPGEVAKRSGVAVSTLHFYETKGLIHSTRNAGNQRRYRRDVLRTVAVIKVAQRIGLSLSSVSEAFTPFSDDHVINKNDWKRLSSGWREELDSRIRMLIALRDQLDSCIGCGCLSGRDCPLRNPEDHLGQEGTGARLLLDD